MIARRKAEGSECAVIRHGVCIRTVTMNSVRDSIHNKKEVRRDRVGRGRGSENEH